MGKSKCEKASEKFVKSMYGDDAFYQDDAMDEAYAFRQGAEALLRYATQEHKRMTKDEACYASDLICAMKQWVKGEE